MRLLLLLVLLGGAVFFFYPLLNEDAGGQCDAFERLAVRLTLASEGGRTKPEQQALGQLVQGLSKGQMANIAVRNEYPNVPVALACTMLYWRALLDPQGFRESALKPRS